MKKLQKGDPVQHRAWFWFGTVLQCPSVLNNTSYLKLKREDGQQINLQLFSVITDPNQFVYDWEDEDETIKTRTTRPRKKSRRKR